LLIATISFFGGGYIALSYAPPILPGFVMGSIPTDEETLTMYNPEDEFCREIDQHITNSALAQKLRQDPRFKEARPHLKIPEAVRSHNLTGGTLSGPGKIVVPPYIWNEEGGKSMVSIFYLGTELSGHPGIVHGGLLATMLDEGLARCCFPALPNKVGVTANLQINYRKPTLAGQFLVLRATTTKVDGRKAWVEGWIESLEGPEGEEPEKLVEATGLFVEPKHAKVLSKLMRIST
jgi:3'-phosphoadenosine 5'-phosphosulfate synthase